MTADERERLLAELLSSELSAEDPAVRRALAEEPALAELVAELRALGGRLDGAGAEQRAVLAAWRGVAAPPGADRVAATLGRLAQADAARRRGLRRVAAAALAAGVLLAALAWTLARARRPDPVYLGGPRAGALALVEPAEPPDAWSTFRWSFELPAGGWYSLEVRAQDAPDDSPPLAAAPRLRRPEWTPEHELPARIRLRVRAFGADAEPLAALDASLSLSSR